MKVWRAESTFVKAWRAEGADGYHTVKTLRLDAAELGLDSNAALKLATAIAQQQLGEETMLLSWYDRERDHGASPG